MKDISERLYLSTIADDCDELALKYGIGLEICEFCTAANMDLPNFEYWDVMVRERLQKAEKFSPSGKPPANGGNPNHDDDDGGESKTAIGELFLEEWEKERGIKK